MRHIRTSYLNSISDASRGRSPRETPPHCGKRVDLPPGGFEAQWFYCGLERGHEGSCEPPGTHRFRITLTRALRTRCRKWFYCGLESAHEGPCDPHDPLRREDA
jgi:hypothetical protein